MIDPRLTRLTEICLALPEAAKEPQGRHATFRVRGKAFAYFLDDHHGDARVAVTFKVSRDEGEAMLASEPDRFFKPSYVARFGYVGLRLDLGDVDWEEVADLVTESYLLTAPTRLAALVTGAGSDAST